MIETYDRYRAGQVSLSELQGVVEAVSGEVDNSAPALLELLRWLSAELEAVRFMWPAEEEQHEVGKRIDTFRSSLSDKDT